MENCKLPRDALIEILSRLSVKSLMRFKCVCKFFYVLIKRDNDFMHKRYQISRAKNNDFAVLEFGGCVYAGSNNLYSLIYKESDSDEIGHIKLDMPNSNVRYVLCCHGMLCLILGRGDFVVLGNDGTNLIFDVLVWNPSTREIKTLPYVKVPVEPPVQCCTTFEGFGFGLSNNMSWKIVMIWYFKHMNVKTKNREIVMVCSQSWRFMELETN